MEPEYSGFCRGCNGYSEHLMLRRDNTWVFVRKDIVEDAIALLKQDEEVERCERCGRVRLRSKWDRR